MDQRKIFFQICVVIVIVASILFPKGGVKVYDIPITWGYLFLAIGAFVYFLSSLKHLKISIIQKLGILFATIGPFNGIIILGLALYGYWSVGVVLALFTATIIMPVLLLIFLHNFWENPKSKEFALITIKWCIFSAAIYGIFLFFYRFQTGQFIEIPYLTVNADDLEGALDKKHNMRFGIVKGEGVVKLISTYNNGNIYAVCTLILLPLYCYWEKSLIRQSIVKSAIVLTLSRTAWAGLVIYEIANAIFQKGIKNLLKLIVVFLGGSIAIYYVLDYLGNDLSWIFSAELGGRSDQFTAFASAQLLPTEKFFHIQEIVYLSILEQFGILGLVAFVIFLIGAPLAGFYFSKKQDAFKRTCLLGCFLYWILCFSDGAFILVPTMCCYWLLVALLLSDNMKMKS